MYFNLLVLHTLTRWLVLISLAYAIYRGYAGWLDNKTFTRFDNTVRHVTATIAHVQLIWGAWLYIISPITNYFLGNFKTAVHERQVRFFGMEHVTVMLIAIVLITVGSAKAKRQATDKLKFKTMAVWYTIAMVLILSSVPWQFSPLISRPYLRWFN
ncbi:hypothetical protein KHS38_06170 [Mucilaginibacter sp. Bleaf8]|uniref:hypothetical protein n=1 Tax=Mucilaginibacter sp. Bleaf8 TaxID=2834430 RepID=UPI001BCFA3F5|nr:hypothetical protein [Mucilaginibacter sp. Bleaf8]MBS7563985.1 hypothetical protein [Mucilaginibacter sp. Bleaf8]